MSQRSGVPFFSSGPDAPRERSASDAFTFCTSFASLLALASIAVPPTGFERAVIDLIDAVPSWLDILWRLGAVSLIAWVLVVVLVAAMRRRLDVMLDVVLAAVVALGLATLASRWINGSWPSMSQILTGGSSGSIPLALLAAGAAAAYAASSHLARSYLRFGRWVVFVAVGSTVMLDATSPVGGVISLLLGGASASLVRLALGASAGRPTPGGVTESLGELGMDLHSMELAPHQAGGVVAMQALADDGAELRVKVYGRDARDAQLLNRVWRALWYRGSPPTATSRLQQVEHEAFVTLFAASKGLAVPSVIFAGRDERRDSIIVMGDVAPPITECTRDEVTAALPGIWGAVADLHEEGMAHGELTPETFGLDEDLVSFRDLGSVMTGASEDQLQTDLAQLLVSSAVVVGVERAVVTAGEELGTDGISAMLPYLQNAALGAPLRRHLKAADFDMDALRSAAAAVVGVEVPEIVKLRRVSPQALVTAALLGLVAFALITSLGNVDISELVDEVSGASPGWVIAALILAQLPFVSQAIATRGASPKAVPLGPLTLLQSGIAFVALAVPSTAGRLALDIRFFQRQGVPAAAAVSISAIDGFSGFLVQIALLILTLVFGVGGVELTFKPSASGGSGEIVVVLAIAAAVVVLIALLALALPRVRSRVMERVRPPLAEVGETVRSLRSPTKLLELFGGNLANQLLFAIALGLCLQAFGESLDLATLLVVYVAAALFGGLMPVPGGIGVMEAALMAGLVAAGVDATAATATALLFRALTFYLPPLWGWLSLRWLRVHDYL